MKENKLTIMAGDFNGDSGWYPNGYHDTHGDARNGVGTKLLVFCDANDLLKHKTNFKKPACDLIISM